MAARLTARDRALRLVSEEALSTFIVDRPDLNRHNGLAQRLGWRVRVTRRSSLAIASSRRKGQPAGDVGMRGYPDLTLVHRRQGRLIYAELKTETNKPTEHQAAWLDDLAALAPDHVGGPGMEGLEVYLWRPRHRDWLPTLLGSALGAAELSRAGVDVGTWWPDGLGRRLDEG